MSVVRHEVRPGAYADSIVLMHLQSSLAALPGVEDAGVAMATRANLELLDANGLLPAGIEELGADDLLLVVRAHSAETAEAALARVDELLAGRRGAGGSEFRPHSLRSAVKLLPSASVVLISVPGRWAARVAREALDHGQHVFLYSDNVALEDELALKERARAAGLLVMGPDCGTAIVGGVGLGFANRVRRGRIGLVGASGTGLQAVTCALHQLGAGVSHALGTGGRDLSERIDGITALQGLELLAGDPATEVIALISKPPAPAVAERVLAAARATGKPVVVHFLGRRSRERERDGLWFSGGLGQTARLAVELLGGAPGAESPESDDVDAEGAEARSGFLRGLFAGGTLALEAQQALAGLERLSSNVPMPGIEPVADLAHSSGHAILDLGADDFTVGRLHPMIDQDLRLRRLRQEAEYPDSGLILLDVVLGDGSHPDPAVELAPEVERARALGKDVVVLMVGTEADPQGLDAQSERLEAAGARVFRDLTRGLRWTGARLGVRAGAAAGPAADQGAGADAAPVPAAGSEPSFPAVDPESLSAPFGAINVGLESFYDSLTDQGAEVVGLDWRPPAGGDERLLALLEKMR